MYTYLVIDDEELPRKGIIQKLSYLENVTCIGEASDGKEGIQKIEELHPNIVILDMQMPIMDGTKLLPYLFKKYPELPLIVVSGYRDFDYIKGAISAHAIDYILKPFSREDIQNCVLTAIKKIEDEHKIQNQIISSEEEKESAYYEYDIQTLNSLIMGYHIDAAKLYSERLSFINHTHNMILMTLYFHNAAPHDLMSKWLDENGFGDLALSLHSPNTPQIEFLIVFIPEDPGVKIRPFITQISRVLISFMEQQQFSLKIGISKTHSSLLELNQAFHETSSALNQQLLGEQSSACYSYTEDETPKLISWEKMEEFLFRVEAGMSKEVEELTDQLFDSFLGIPELTLGDVKYFCYHLSDQCRIILNYYLNQNDPISESAQNIVSRIFQLDELKDYYMQFFLNITNMVCPQSIYAADDVITNIQTYIQHNYFKNLTQEFIASLFYLNRSYLSTLFKNRTGMKFIDYLNQIRIEKSKELLLNSNRKMYSVAKAVGYDNVKYYFRIFKKKTGYTPEQYRKLQDSK